MAQGQDAVPAGRHEPAAGCPAASRLNPMLRGWCAYFRPGVSSATFQYLSAYVWRRVIRLAAPQTPPDHAGRTSAAATAAADGGPAGRRTGTVQPRQGAHHAATATGDQSSRPPGRPADEDQHEHPTGTCGEPGAGDGHAGFGRRPGETGRPKDRHRAPGRLHHDRIGKTGVTSKQDLKSKAVGALRRLQKRPGLVRAFFADPHLRYITA